MAWQKIKKPKSRWFGDVFYYVSGANHSWLEHTHGLAEKINGEYYGTGQTQLLGFVVVDMGVFLGIILGCTIAWVHNKVSPLSCPARCRCTAAPS
jgi:PTS system arbutin-like IIC component